MTSVTSNSKSISCQTKEQAADLQSICFELDRYSALQPLRVRVIKININCKTFEIRIAKQANYSQWHSYVPNTIKADGSALPFINHKLPSVVLLSTIEFLSINETQEIPFNFDLTLDIKEVV